MHSFVRKHPEFALMGGQGRKRLCLYEVADPEGVDWATAYLLAHGGFVARCEVKGILKDRGLCHL
jgi:hypothetical protein